MLAPRPAAIDRRPDGLAVEDVTFPSESGATIAGWFHGGRPGRGVIVLVHGIRSNRKSQVHRARLLAEAGFSTLLIDLRLHGESRGDGGHAFIALGHLERHDVRAAVAFARQRRPGEPIGVVGFSLGGAATALAAPLDADAVVLEAVFPSIDAAVANRAARLGPLKPLASWALLVQLEPRTGVRVSDLRPVDTVAELGCPVMIVGGDLDKQTTPADTRRLFAAAAEPKQLVWFDGLGHRNFAYWQPERYRATVVAFLEEHLAGGFEQRAAGDRGRAAEQAR
ncbi:MAG: alpha/beta fold hydrolase [Planctomycetota bacterium]